MINDFGNGPTYNIGAADELKFPYLWVENGDINTVFSANGMREKRLTFNLYLMDKINKGDDNFDEIISDTEFILSGIIQEFSQLPFYVQNKLSLFQDINLTPVVEATDDNVNGWQATISLKIPIPYTYCEMPIRPFVTPVIPQPCPFEPILIENNLGCQFLNITEYPSGGVSILPQIQIFDGVTSLGNYDITNRINFITECGIDNIQYSIDGCELNIDLGSCFPIQLVSGEGCLLDEILTYPSGGTYTLSKTEINDDNGAFDVVFIGQNINVIGGTISAITTTNSGCDTNIILNEVEQCFPINIINTDNCDFGQITECTTCTGFTWDLRIGVATTVQGIELLDCEGNVYNTITDVLTEGDYSFCHNSLSVPPEIISQTGLNVTWNNTSLVCDSEVQYFTLSDIPVSDDTGSLGSVAVPTSVVIDGEATIALSGCVLTVIPIPPTPVGINYQRPTWTGQLTSYAVGDVGWQASNDTYNWVYTGGTHARLDFLSADAFYTLVDNNTFGNTFRFTTDDGTPASDGKADFIITDFSSSTENYIIDHLTGYGWARGKIAFTEIWSDAIATANAYTFSGGTYSDFRLPSLSEIESVLNWTGEYYQSENIFDRNAFIAGNDNTLWLADTDELTSTTNAYKLFAAGDIRRQAKTASTLTGTYVCRTHY
jgi:hypothetical protein